MMFRRTEIPVYDLRLTNIILRTDTLWFTWSTYFEHISTTLSLLFWLLLVGVLEVEFDSMCWLAMVGPFVLAISDLRWSRSWNCGLIRRFFSCFLCVFPALLVVGRSRRYSEVVSINIGNYFKGVLCYFASLGFPQEGYNIWLVVWTEGGTHVFCFIWCATRGLSLR